jgi:V/A-type H+-transporting ATPase subunit I
MIWPEKMSFVNISVLDNCLTQALSVLAKLGVMHVVDKEEIPSIAKHLVDLDVEPIRDKFTSLNSRVEHLLLALGIEPKYLSATEGVNPDEIEIDPFQSADRVEMEVQELESSLLPIIHQREQFNTEINELERISRWFSAIEIKDMTVENMQHTRLLYFAFGDIPSEYYDRLVNSLANITCVLVRGEFSAGRQQIFAFSLMSDKEVLSNALETAFFSETSIPDKYHGSIPQALDDIEIDIWTKREESAEFQGQIKIFRKDLQKKLMELRATIIANQIVVESASRFGKTERFYSLSGWIPYKEVKKLQKELDKIAEQGIFMTVSEPFTSGEADHQKLRVPTSLWHPFFMRPFSGLIKNYGIPKYSEIDPTLFTSITFLFMFGVMFADVGHGAVLLLIGLLGALYPLPQLKSMRQLFAMLACCGGAAIIAGFAFGSVFGKEDIIKPFWFSLENMKAEPINRILKFGVFFGVAMLSLGVFLNVIQLLRRRNFNEAFCGQWGLSSLLFYWTAIFMLLTSKAFSWDKVLIVFVFLLPIILKEPIAHIFSRKHTKVEASEGEESEEGGEGFIGSLLHVYEIMMSYLANTLSFIRMAAFNLAHASLMMAAYAITKQTAGDNIFMSLSSDIMTNVFVMMLEGLIVMIQCIRLQYYEFFSKYFTGDGVEYKPLKIS